MAAAAGALEPLPVTARPRLDPGAGRLRQLANLDAMSAIASGWVSAGLPRVQVAFPWW